MKNRIRIAEIIMALVFISATASAQKPNNIGKSEILEITSSITSPVTIIVNDAEGSPYTRVEMDGLVRKMYLRFTQRWPRANTCEIATLINGKLRWQVMSHVSFLQANPKAKDTWGFVSFQSSIGGLSPDVPAANVYYAGTLQTRWSEDEQRFYIVGGKGTISGFSNSNPIVKSYTDEAALGLQDRYLPAFGSFFVRSVKYTDSQIKNILIKESIK